MIIAVSNIEHITVIITIILHIYFLYRTLETKVNKKNQALAIMIFSFVRMSYYSMDVGYRPYFSVIAGILYASYVFNGNIKIYTIWSVIPVVLDGIVDATIIYGYLLLPGTSIEQINLIGIHRIFIIIIAKTSLFLIYSGITHRIDKSHRILQDNFLVMIAVPLGCWIMIEILFRYNESISSPLIVSGSAALLFMMTSVITLYNRITADAKELAQSKLQLRVAEITQDHINQINKMYGELSSLHHDLHNHFIAIKGYLKSKEYAALEHYIGKLTTIPIKSLVYVKHPVLNAIISYKASLAENEGIKFTADITLPEKLPITDVDLCILISNILDNAFEANAQATEPRYIDIYTRVMNSYWIVACRNKTHKLGRLKATGSLKSTKEANGIHGIGTKQIQKIAEKTGGFVSYKHENYEFSILIMIKMNSLEE